MQNCDLSTEGLVKVQPFPAEWASEWVAERVSDWASEWVSENTERQINNMILYYVKEERICTFHTYNVIIIFYSIRFKWFLFSQVLNRLYIHVHFPGYLCNYFMEAVYSCNFLSWLWCIWKITWGNDDRKRMRHDTVQSSQRYFASITNFGMALGYYQCFNWQSTDYRTRIYKFIFEHSSCTVPFQRTAIHHRFLIGQLCSRCESETTTQPVLQTGSTFHSNQTLLFVFNTEQSDFVA